jgi:hypothetical protein
MRGHQLAGAQKKDEPELPYDASFLLLDFAYKSLPLRILRGKTS